MCKVHVGSERNSYHTRILIVHNIITYCGYYILPFSMILCIKVLRLKTTHTFSSTPLPSHEEYAVRCTVFLFTRREPAAAGRAGRKRSRKCVPQLSRKTYIRGRRYTFTTLTRAPLSSPPPFSFEFVAPEIYYNAPSVIRREYSIIL